MTPARPRVRHELRVWADSFHDLSLGIKKAEVRRCDDRDYRRGDELLLREYAASTGAYTGRALLARVTHLVRWAGDLELLGQAPALVCGLEARHGGPHGVEPPGGLAPIPLELARPICGAPLESPAPVRIVVMSLEVAEVGKYDDMGGQG